MSSELSSWAIATSALHVRTVARLSRICVTRLKVDPDVLDNPRSCAKSRSNTFWSHNAGETKKRHYAPAHSRDHTINTASLNGASGAKIRRISTRQHATTRRTSCGGRDTCENMNRSRPSSRTHQPCWRGRQTRHGPARLRRLQYHPCARLGRHAGRCPMQSTSASPRWKLSWA